MAHCPGTDEWRAVCLVLPQHQNESYVTDDIIDRMFGIMLPQFISSQLNCDSTDTLALFPGGAWLHLLVPRHLGLSTCFMELWLGKGVYPYNLRTYMHVRAHTHTSKKQSKHHHVVSWQQGTSLYHITQFDHNDLLRKCNYQVTQIIGLSHGSWHSKCHIPCGWILWWLAVQTQL